MNTEALLIKIGSAGISRQNIERVCADIQTITATTSQRCIVVSSGAVKLGKESEGHDYQDAAFYAGIGQRLLMNLYQGALSNNKGAKPDTVAQLLTTDFINSEASIHFVSLIHSYLNRAILPIINYNDAMNDDEMKKISIHADNDRNALNVAQKVMSLGSQIGLRISTMVYLTSTSGILDNNGGTIPGGEIDIQDIENEKKKALAFVDDSKSDYGTGGMRSKIDCVFGALQLGVRRAIIANVASGLDCLNDASIGTQYNIIIPEQ